MGGVAPVDDNVTSHLRVVDFAWLTQNNAQNKVELDAEVGNVSSLSESYGLWWYGPLGREPRRDPLGPRSPELPWRADIITSDLHKILISSRNGGLDKLNKWTV